MREGGCAGTVTYDQWTTFVESISQYVADAIHKDHLGPIEIVDVMLRTIKNIASITALQESILGTSLCTHVAILYAVEGLHACWSTPRTDVLRQHCANIFRVLTSGAHRAKLLEDVGAVQRLLVAAGRALHDGGLCLRGDSCSLLHVVEMNVNHSVLEALDEWKSVMRAVANTFLDDATSNSETFKCLIGLVPSAFNVLRGDDDMKEKITDHIARSAKAFQDNVECFPRALHALDECVRRFPQDLSVALLRGIQESVQHAALHVVSPVKDAATKLLHTVANIKGVMLKSVEVWKEFPECVIQSGVALVQSVRDDVTQSVAALQAIASAVSSVVQDFPQTVVEHLQHTVQDALSKVLGDTVKVFINTPGIQQAVGSIIATFHSVKDLISTCCESWKGFVREVVDVVETQAIRVLTPILSGASTFAACITNGCEFATQLALKYTSLFKEGAKYFKDLMRKSVNEVFAFIGLFPIDTFGLPIPFQVILETVLALM